MLSKKDIQKELGKGINIYPFTPDNIKENSINLSTSKYAWPMSDGVVFIREDGEVFNDNSFNRTFKGKKVEIKKGGKAVHDTANGQIIILLPFSTTLIETQEVLAVEKHIAGTYHSKVGLASHGIGHIGTMLGPGFSGHSLIAIHNISSKPLKLNVGESFVSVIFNYLNTPLDTRNNTDNGHLDKMSEFGIILKPDERKNLNEDWKKSVLTVRDKMIESDTYKKYKVKLKSQNKALIKRYLTVSNSLLVLGIIIAVILLYFLALKLDSQTVSPVWEDRFWNVIFSGSGMFFIGLAVKFIKPKEFT